MLNQGSSLQTMLRRAPSAAKWRASQFLRRLARPGGSKPQRHFGLRATADGRAFSRERLAGAVLHPQPKRALLAYITHPFSITRRNPLNDQFSNVGIAKSLVRVLSELGYLVDVVQYDDTSFVPRTHYDVFIGHLGTNFQRISEELDPDTVRVYFASTAYWRYHNEQEYGRLAALEQRKGTRLPPDLGLDPGEEWALANSDGIVCMGNHATRETFGRFPVVHNIHNASYKDTHFDHLARSFPAAARSFLFFAGGGNVHKGLDLLLDAFWQLEEDLYVCTRLDPAFAGLYRRELKDCANIHAVGWVDMRTPLFYKIVDQCAYTILPSCSEGSPGSVVECMNQGMIPIVSRSSGIDTCDFGITLEECSVEKIIETVSDLSRRPVDWVSEMSLRARHAAVTTYTESLFQQAVKRAISSVIAEPLYRDRRQTDASGLQHSTAAGRKRRAPSRCHLP
jgi:hypothetical protein